MGLGSILGSVGGILSGVSAFGAKNSADDALEAQSAISNRLLDAQLGKFIDARGNVVEYDEDTRTWSVTLSDGSQQIINASDAEELARLTVDANLRRQGVEANADRRVAEGQSADRFLNEINQPSPYTQEGIEGALLQRYLRGVDEAFRGVTQDFARQNLRTGNTGGGQVLAELAKRRSDATSDAFANAGAESFGLAENLNNSRNNRLLTSYNTLASRASNFDDVPFTPTSIGRETSGTALSRGAGSIGAGQVAAGALNAGFAPLNWFRQPGCLPVPWYGAREYRLRHLRGQQ